MSSSKRYRAAIVATVLTFLSGIARADDDKIFSTLSSRVDVTAQVSDAVSFGQQLERRVREAYAEVPDEFAIVLIGQDLKLEGITTNQAIGDVDVKQATVAELLTILVRKMNPIRTVRDLSSGDQMVVWTVGVDPRGENKSKVVLITTRRAAEARRYALPAEFLKADQRDAALPIDAAPLQRRPARAAADEKAKRIEETKLLGWSKTISSATIEDEIKALKLALDIDVRSYDKFAAGGYKQCRTRLTELAVLFAVISEYDEDVRWKDDSPLARELFTDAAQICKVGAKPSFTVAKERTMDLNDLLRGGHIMRDGAKKLEWRAAWGTVGDRAPLMQRMEQALMQNLKPQVADARTFRASRDKLAHEAEMIRIIATVLSKDGREDAADADYGAAAKRLQTASGDLIEAVKLTDFDRATAAVTRIEMSCSNCHENFR